MNKEELKNILEQKFVKKFNLYLDNGLWNCDDNVDESYTFAFKIGKIKGDFY